MKADSEDKLDEEELIAQVGFLLLLVVVASVES